MEILTNIALTALLAFMVLVYVVGTYKVIKEGKYYE